MVGETIPVTDHETDESRGEEDAGGGCGEDMK